MTSMNLDTELTCKPLDTYSEIQMFLQDPPPWRTLCKELTPHSNLKIKNIEINNMNSDPKIEYPESFCHFNPEHDDVQRYDEKQLPKTLVCHDMANGYHDDRFIHGTGNYDAYTFYNWAGIDIFCYFSHHLITIPPLGWINVGHAHGVKVIGTVITEWAEGSVFWEKVLESEEGYQNFASALVAIAKTLKFDGWLLNVENKISKPAALVEFVRHLHALLHQELPHAELVWYDSVTLAGTLNWQNGLNDKNKAYFEACDGIFTNYSWSESDIVNSALAAGDRVHDVYVGVDVWGRNFYGGGQFNTQKALQVVYEHGCSVAIFAPAWSHEAMSADREDPAFILLAERLDRLERFLLRDRALWTSLWPYLRTRPLAVLPFTTSFCRGHGRRRWLHGEVVSPQPWYNLRHQQYQPNSALGPHGYIISPADTIHALSHQALSYDVRGILRYRKRKATGALLQEGEVGREPEPEPRPEDAEPERQFTRDLRNSIDEQPPPPLEPEHDPPPAPPVGKSSSKQLMKEALMKLFHVHGRETARDSGPVENERELVERGAPSVSLRLGASEAAARDRYGLAVVAGDRQCLEPYYEDAFTGGASLRLNPCEEGGEVCRARLFHCEVVCTHALVACVVTKPVGPEMQHVSVELRGSRAGGELRVMLVPRAVPGAEYPRAPPAGLHHLYALDPASPHFRELQRYLLLHQNNFYVPIENSFGWRVMYYEVVAPGFHMTSLNCALQLAEGAVLLGHLGLCDLPAAALSAPNTNTQDNY